MAMSRALKLETIEEWRELGYYYDYDKEEKFWIIIGSKEGILKFCQTLKQYSQNPNNNTKSEHDHLGPYMYLKIVTWNEAFINDDGIYGSLEDLSKLADIIKACSDKAAFADIITIDKEYSSSNHSYIKIFVREDDFDPASPDTQLFE
ncbi:MAG: hypothetical protein GYA50_06945 [Eubacteriaceae bacterium]|nr:hypothetical protein [Eubacteriaceae bacterium]